MTDEMNETVDWRPNWGDRKRRAAAVTGCHAGRDGECNWKHCPQERDGEPARTGRHCPLDVDDEGNDGDDYADRAEWKARRLTPEEIDKSLDEYLADLIVAVRDKTRKKTLEEAAQFVEENYEEPFTNVVGNPSWRERGPKKLAAAIRALKDKS